MKLNVNACFKHIDIAVSLLGNAKNKHYARQLWERTQSNKEKKHNERKKKFGWNQKRIE